MSREYLPCPPQMRNGGPPPAHLSSSSAFALGESRWLYPPQRAPDVLRPPILASMTKFLLSIAVIDAKNNQALVACIQRIKTMTEVLAEKMGNGGSPPAHLPSSTAFALEKDFSRHWDEVKGTNALIERHLHDEAASAKAVDDEWLHLKDEACIGIDEERRRHNNEWLCWHRIKEEVRVRRRQEAACAKAVDDERLRLLAEERPQTTESAELALAEECCCHDAGTQIAMSAESSRADECRHHEAAAQAAESAVLRLAEERGRHEATELATMSAMRLLAASQDCADIEAIAYKAPALPTTTSPEPPAMLSPSPRPTSSYLGAVLNTNGGGC